MKECSDRVSSKVISLDTAASVAYDSLRENVLRSLLS
jgi:hypothetical protein